MAYEPLIGDPNFFERQGPVAGCGRHALNNFFGGNFFTTSKEAAYTEEELIAAGKDLSGTPMDLTRVCKSLLKTGGDACPANEDYDITTLTYALVIAGYGVETLQTLTDPSGLGYIINLGGTPERSGHWVSLRIVGSGLVFKDSLASAAVPYANIAAFLTAKSASFVGKYQRILAITERSLDKAQRAIILAKVDTIIEKLRKTIKEERQLSAIRHILVNLSLDQIIQIYANPDYKVNIGALRQYVATDLAIREGKDVSEAAFKTYEGDRRSIIDSLSQVNDRSTQLTRLLRQTRTTTDEADLQGLLNGASSGGSPPSDLSGPGPPSDLSGPGPSGSPPSGSPPQSRTLPPKPAENTPSNLTNFFTNQNVPQKFITLQNKTTFDSTLPEIDFLDMHGLVTHVSDTKATVDPAAQVFYEKNGIFYARTVPDADEPWRLTQMWNWVNGSIPEKPSIGPEDKERLTKYLVLMKDVVLPQRILKVSESMPGPDQAEINEMKSYIQYLETVLGSVPQVRASPQQAPSPPPRNPPPKAVFTVYTTGLAEDTVRKAWIDNGLTQKIKDQVKMEVKFKHYDPGFTAETQRGLEGECIKAPFTYKDFVLPYIIIDCAHSYKYNPDKTKSLNPGSKGPATLGANVPIVYLGYPGTPDYTFFNKQFFEFKDLVTTYIDKLIDKKKLDATKQGDLIYLYPNEILKAEPGIIDTLWTT